MKKKVRENKNRFQSRIPVISENNNSRKTRRVFQIVENPIQKVIHVENLLDEHARTSPKKKIKIVKKVGELWWSLSYRNQLSIKKKVLTLFLESLEVNHMICVSMHYIA